MPILNVKGHLPGTAVAVTIIVDTEKVSFISPCPGCNLVQIHSCGSYFETDRLGANLILNAMKDDLQAQDIKLLTGYENIVDWPE